MAHGGSCLARHRATIAVNTVYNKCVALVVLLGGTLPILIRDAPRATLPLW